MNLARDMRSWGHAARHFGKHVPKPNAWKTAPLTQATVRRLLAEGREARKEIDERLEAMERAARVYG